MRATAPGVGLDPDPDKAELALALALALAVAEVWEQPSLRMLVHLHCGPQASALAKNSNHVRFTAIQRVLVYCATFVALTTLRMEVISKWPLHYVDSAGKVRQHHDLQSL